MYLIAFFARANTNQSLANETKTENLNKKKHTTTTTKTIQYLKLHLQFIIK